MFFHESVREVRPGSLYFKENSCCKESDKESIHSPGSGGTVRDTGTISTQEIKTSSEKLLKQISKS